MINSARLTGSLMTPLWVFRELISIKNMHVQRVVCVVYLHFQQILIFFFLIFKKKKNLTIMSVFTARLHFNTFMRL